MDVNSLNCCLFLMVRTCLCALIVVHRGETSDIKPMENSFNLWYDINLMENGFVQWSNIKPLWNSFGKWYKFHGKLFRSVIWYKVDGIWFQLVILCRKKMVPEIVLLLWFNAILCLCLTYLWTIIDALVTCDWSTSHWDWLTWHMLVVELWLLDGDYWTLWYVYCRNVIVLFVLTLCFYTM